MIILSRCKIKDYKNAKLILGTSETKILFREIFQYNLFYVDLMVSVKLLGYLSLSKWAKIRMKKYEVSCLTAVLIK